MKVLLLLCLSGLAMAFPMPGGYLAKGGAPAYGPPAPHHAPAKLPPQPFAYQYGVEPAPPKYSPAKRSAPEYQLQKRRACLDGPQFSPTGMCLEWWCCR